MLYHLSYLGASPILSIDAQAHQPPSRCDHAQCDRILRLDWRRSHMGVLIIASSQPRVGRSMIAAALAYRCGRDGTPVTLARLAGDGSADADARTFASLEYIVAADKAL